MNKDFRKPKNKYEAQAKGLEITIASLKAKMAELEKNRKNDKEDVRGFSDGGSSIKSEDRSDEKYITSEIATTEERLLILGAQKDLNEIFEKAAKERILENDEDDGKGGGSFKYQSREQAARRAQEIIEKYKTLGFSCEVSESKNGDIEIKVQLPKELEGKKNPLEMSETELQEAKDLTEQEKETNQSDKKFSISEKPSSSPRSPFGSEKLLSKTSQLEL